MTKIVPIPETVRVLAAIAVLVVLGGASAAGIVSTTTTVTLPPGTTTTTMFVPNDVTGGGTFEGTIPAGSFDSFSFDLIEPRVLIAETTNGFGGCPADTLIELRRLGGPGNCNGMYGDDLPCIAFDDDSGIALCSRLVKYVLPPGPYEIRVSKYGGTALRRYFLHVSFEAIECGNGVVELTEGCDDGNVTSEDCCSPTCQKDAAGSSCNDGLSCNGPDTCNADGVCSVHSGDFCPGPDGDGDCAESCSDADGSCTGLDPNGAPCDDGIYCNGADTCLGGSCSVHAGTPCPGADGDGNCSETCNEAAKNCKLPDPNGSVCNDSVYCNGADTCQSGSCSAHVGTPCPGADGDANCSETCNELSRNCTKPDPNGSVCNDNLFCNGADTCQSGQCSQHVGNPCPGVDGDSNCAESCNETSDVCTGLDPNGSGCNDGIFCNGADTCLTGVCSQHAGNPCPGVDGDGNCAESCNEASDTCTTNDPNGSACSDGLFCNGADSCQAGVCSGHVGNPCPGPDGDGNCLESCNENTDNCASADPNGSACSDGLFCNGADTCQSGACSGHVGNPCPGVDGDGNCSESCNEVDDNCANADPNGSACSDSLFCNGADTCASGACGTHTGNPCPGADNDGNCSETCDENADHCAGADLNGSDCNDGIFCNGLDNCLSGVCSLHSGNFCLGPDGDVNCSETCSEPTKSCRGSDPDGSVCDDALVCNGDDSCVAGVCNGHSAPACAGPDGDADCAESCSDVGEGCLSFDPEGTPCDDGIFCNGLDMCAAGSCSVHAGDPCSGGDGDGNCSESCNESADTCTAPDVNGAPCQDGLFCNGADTCLAGACSAHVGDPCPGGEADANCAESCSEAADNCFSADPNGTACNDQLFCNGADSCSGGACSVHASSPCDGPDSDADCTESCDEVANNCDLTDPDQFFCNDGLFCNGADTCLSGACSVHAGNPCVGADGDSNCSESCSEASDNCLAADPNGSVCNDDLFCNGADTCAAGACSAHVGSPCVGADGDANCSESCSEALDNCLAADPNGSVCNDSLFCNGADTCSSGACSGHVGSPCPGADGDANCAETCRESSDDCLGADGSGTICTDTDPCTATAKCNGIGSCIGLDLINCDDGNECTADSCISGGTDCSHLVVPSCLPSTTTTLGPVHVCGDANGDGLLKASDALAVLKAAVAAGPCGAAPCVCDANGNGSLSASDALAVLKVAVGGVNALKCPC